MARAWRRQERPSAAKRPARSAPKAAEPRCPICGKPTEADYRPFCSNRCANVDLHRWLSGSYAVPGESITEVDDADDE